MSEGPRRVYLDPATMKQVAATDLPTTPDAGWSDCPICQRHYLVTPADDCLMPACGCYGTDTSPDNPARPCEDCGLMHAITCPKMPR